MCFETGREAVENQLMNSPHNENLFRLQALEALSRKPPGRPICLMPRPWLWLTLLVALLFASAGVFVVSAEYSRKETVQGWLVSKAGVFRMRARNAAVIREVVPQAGEFVEQGDPLIYLSSDSTLANGDSKSQEVLRQLRQELLEIDNQLALSQKDQQNEEESLRQQLQSFDTEVIALNLRLEDQKRRLETSTKKLQRLRSALLEKAVPEWDVIKQEEETGIVAQGHRRLQQDIALQQRERARLKAREGGLVTQAEIRRSTLRTRHRQLLQHIAEQESQRLSVLKAPVSGVVSTVEVRAGFSVMPQQLLLTVIPDGADLAAELFVPSRAAGFMQSGQNVRIAYQAFPQAKFGTFDGRISRVSEYILLPGEIPQTFSIREATYKIQVALATSSIETSAGIVALRPGMLLAADIILEERTLVDWLMEPMRLRRLRDTT